MARINRYLSLVPELERFLFSMRIGNRLPSEQELADRFSVSKPTLRRAMAELEKKKLIRTENGIGSIMLAYPKTLSKELIFLCEDLVFFADTLKVFSTESANRGCISSIIPFCGDRIMRERILQTVLSRNPAGIILYAKSENDMDFPVPKEIPVLQLIRRRPEIPGDLLTFHNEASEERIVRCLYRRGCRKFALYGPGGINLSAAAERTQGFLNGMRKVRLRVRKKMILPPGSRETAVEEFFRNFSSDSSRPDAVCCLNDHCAGHFFMEMNRRGLSLDHIRISGFDASKITTFFPKSILTVRPPLKELGKRAVELLIRRIENPGLAEVDESLKSDLIDTESGWLIPKNA